MPGVRFNKSRYPIGQIFRAPTRSSNWRVFKSINMENVDFKKVGFWDHNLHWFCVVQNDTKSRHIEVMVGAPLDPGRIILSEFSQKSGFWRNGGTAVFVYHYNVLAGVQGLGPRGRCKQLGKTASGNAPVFPSVKRTPKQLFSFKVFLGGLFLAAFLSNWWYLSDLFWRGSHGLPWHRIWLCLGAIF